MSEYVIKDVGNIIPAEEDEPLLNEIITLIRKYKLLRFITEDSWKNGNNDDGIKILCAGQELADAMYNWIEANNLYSQENEGEYEICQKEE